MTLPISWKGTIVQYVGRLHRLHDTKKEVHVYDYADLSVPMLEIDGVQHLASKDAYRRDRRKDFLLQPNGYLILRFLASDVSRELDRVLDTILRILSRKLIE